MARKNVPTELFDACLLAAEQVKASGSPELNAAMRVVLFILGQEIAREMAAEPSAPAPDRLELEHS